MKFYQCPLKIFNNLKQEWLDTQPNEIDENIFDVINKINSHPGLVTLYSCEGHFHSVEKYEGYIMIAIKDQNSFVDFMEFCSKIGNNITQINFSKSPELQYNRLMIRFKPGHSFSSLKEWYAFLRICADDCFV